MKGSKPVDLLKDKSASLLLDKVCFSWSAGKKTLD